jgi:AraC-like DNA-binding protein
MEQLLFCKTFSFQTIHLHTFRHTDATAGIPTHFIARMRHGSGVIRALSGEELHLCAGDIFYLPLGLQYHSYWAVEEAEDRTVSWESYGFTHLPLRDEIQYKMQKIKPSETALQWLDRLAQDQTVSPSSVGYLYLFLSEVLPEMESEESHPKQALLEKALDYIQRHEGFTVPELARVCCISESALYSLFRTYAGATPIEIKNSLKAERAIALLSTTELSVEAIAASLGFCSAAHLRKVLKKHTGRTPSQIRRAAKMI